MAWPAHAGLFDMVKRRRPPRGASIARQVRGDHLTVAEPVLAGEAIILVDRHIHAACAEGTRLADEMRAACAARRGQGQTPPV